MVCARVLLLFLLVVAIPAKAVEGIVVSSVTNTAWTTVTLSQTYISPVVVCTPNYDSTVVPLVVRIDNAAANSFDLRVDRTDTSTESVGNIVVHCLAVEEGVYTQSEDGIVMEAVKYVSTVTDRRGSWNGESRGYINTYTNPVVVGQVTKTGWIR